VLSLYQECKYLAVIFTACKMWKFTLVHKLVSPHTRLMQLDQFVNDSFCCRNHIVECRISHVFTEISWAAWRMLNLHAPYRKVGSEKLHVMGKTLQMYCIQNVGKPGQSAKIQKTSKNTRERWSSLVTHASLVERD
jgi:hypothetical protein